jgi:hypothetical protein
VGKSVLGIVIRFSDMLEDSPVDTIGAHNKIIKQEGEVFVGKFGQPVAKKHIRYCCAEDSRIKLILVKRDLKGVYKAYQATIESAQKTKPVSKLIPPHVRKRKDISCWFKITTSLKLISNNNFNKWMTISSNMPLVASLIASMSGMFYAVYSKSADSDDSEAAIRRVRRRNVKGKGLKRKRRAGKSGGGFSGEDDFHPISESSFEDDDDWY